jgi:hypothetical protein
MPWSTTTPAPVVLAERGDDVGGAPRELPIHGATCDRWTGSTRSERRP